MKNNARGYYRHPTVQGETLVFVCEADLWSVSILGGQARRLTVNQIGCYSPFISPDGKIIAFAAVEEGSPEIYAIPAVGGHSNRLSFQATRCYVCGWTPDGKSILYASSNRHPFRHITSVWSLAPEGGIPQMLPFGPVSRISYGPGNGLVISRKEQEYFIWKRYRGGNSGEFWIDRDGSGNFEQILSSLEGNKCNPMWAFDRIYFQSDYEGHGNLYSCDLQGTDIQRHTHHEDFYVRAATSDGKLIVYQCGAEIYVYDPQLDVERKIDIEVNSSKPQLTRKFVDPLKYMEQYELHPEGHSLLITTRGKPFVMGNWEREVQQIGVREGVRYRLTKWLHDGQRLITVSDQGGEEALEVHPVLTHKSESINRFDSLDTGRILDVVASPVNSTILLSNQRNEIMWLDLKRKDLKIIDKSHYSSIRGMAFSPDGRWVAYAASKEPSGSQIYLCELSSGTITQVTQPVGLSMRPSFDPSGKYLFFISYRIFNPVYDTMRFDIGFPKGAKPYLVTLQQELCSPFNPPPKPFTKLGPEEALQNSPHSPSKIESQSVPKAGQPISIDLDGIEHRIIAFPVPEEIYTSVQAAKGKVFFSVFPVEGRLDEDNGGNDGARGILKSFHLETQKEEIFTKNINSFQINQDYSALVYQSGRKIRVITTEVKPSDEDQGPGRLSGWIDLDRIRVSVVPRAEWKQMYRELWLLQREHFWTTSMANVDWEEVYHRYEPLLERVATRSEFSDLAWEVHGELGTSHAYEIGGDRPIPKGYGVGKLGADIGFDGKEWIIEHIVRGDCWDPQADLPLNAPGLNVEKGAVLVAVDGVQLTASLTPDELLVNKTKADVALTIRSPRTDQDRTITVKTLQSDENVRYREWVETNRHHVHQATAGKVGYVHIPNMGPAGYAEFFRSYVAEWNKDGLIVDVRYNGGGHASQLLLEKLARRRLGYSVSHHLSPSPLPLYSVLGPIVALTNEFAGSDGDIFSHSFKSLKLGTLIGKRTWGGVIGISSHARLVDRTLVTQPEFATWYNDVGFGVENFGAVPDIEVEITPQDYLAGKDTQLEKAIELALEKLKENPPHHPDFKDIPDRSRTKLPGK